MTLDNPRAGQAVEVALAKRSQQKTLVYSAILFALVLTFYGSVYFLWMVNPSVYHQVMGVLSIQAGDTPFLDTRAWLSWIECRGQGYDVLVSNPCTNPINYSPVFLDLPPWSGISETQPVGLAISGAFLFTLPFLLRPSSLYELFVGCLSAASTSVVLAAERANLDVLIFMLIAVAILLHRRNAAPRLFSYAIFIISGMLKFYPFVLLSTSLRERPRACLAVTAVSAAIIVGAAFEHWMDLRIILSRSQQGGYIIWGATFGARELAIGLAYFFPNIKLAPFVGVEIVCVAFFYLTVRMWISFRQEARAFPSGGSASEFLVLGSILIVACFFAGPNGGYRAIFLLFLLPGLREITTEDSLTRFRCVLALTQIVILLLLWEDLFRHAIDVLFEPTGSEHGLAELPFLVFFMLRELGWWFVVAVASAIAALFFSRSQTLRWILPLPQRAPDVAV